jgi:hypothetical protein
LRKARGRFFVKKLRKKLSLLVPLEPPQPIMAAKAAIHALLSVWHQSSAEYASLFRLTCTGGKRAKVFCGAFLQKSDLFLP